jgi:transposase
VRLRPRWKDQHRAKPFPPEFRRDVIAGARKCEASISQVARDFGISESCLQRWLKIADRDDGLAPPATGDRGGGGRDESAELRELRRRNKLLEQENEILRRATAYFARDVLPK